MKKLLLYNQFERLAQSEGHNNHQRQRKQRSPVETKRHEQGTPTAQAGDQQRIERISSEDAEDARWQKLAQKGLRDILAELFNEFRRAAL